MSSRRLKTYKNKKMENKIIISIMTENDIPSIAQLEKESFAAPWSEEALSVELANERALFLTAKDTGRLLGYIGSHLIMGECYITNIAVFKKSRRRGVAKALINELFRLLCEENAQFLTLEVRRSNKAAISLYEKTGFVLSGEIKNMYEKPCEDALIYTRTVKEERSNENTCLRNIL